MIAISYRPDTYRDAPIPGTKATFLWLFLLMASVYILYSDSAERFYIGVTKDLFSRINFHQIKEFPKSFTAKHNDWSLFFSIDNLTISRHTRLRNILNG